MGIALLVGLLLSIFQGTPWWAVGAILVVGLLGLGLPRNGEDAESTPDSSNSKSRDELDIHSNCVAAQQTAEMGGFLGVMARNWLKAYDEDPSVPPFGVRPYWTPTGPGGAPQFLSTMGFQGVERRLDYVHQAANDDSLLSIMSYDPHQCVRDAVRVRLG